MDKKIFSVPNIARMFSLSFAVCSQLIPILRSAVNGRGVNYSKLHSPDFLTSCLHFGLGNESCLMEPGRCEKGRNYYFSVIFSGDGSISSVHVCQEQWF